MAISSGVRSHRCWVEINGQTFPITTGSASQTATKKSATFSGVIPMGTPGALTLLASLGENDASIFVQSGGAAKALVVGEIDNVDFDYIGGNMTVSGRCKSAKLHQTKSAEKWVNKKNPDIVKDIAGRVGLTADVGESTVDAGKYVNIDWSKLTDGISFATILHKIAEVEGARWWTNGGKLFFKSDSDSATAYPITYSAQNKGGSVNGKSADFLQLRIRRNVQAGKSVKVDVKSWNTRKKKAFTGTQTIGGAGGTTNYVYHVPGLDQAHADKHAKSKAKEHSRHELTVHVSCVGDPEIDIAQKLRLRGTDFDQDFEMDSIGHSFGLQGHTMSISAKSAKAGRKAS
jgi:phage protein D